MQNKRSLLVPLSPLPTPVPHDDGRSVVPSPSQFLYLETQSCRVDVGMPQKGGWSSADRILLHRHARNMWVHCPGTCSQTQSGRWNVSRWTSRNYPADFAGERGIDEDHLGL